ncbi:MAG: FAD-dependent oxidoreductase [Burkholderiales bacterium]|nr:FAD-dependent oxidoreductase [Burkholderiales bacterium]
MKPGELEALRREGVDFRRLTFDLVRSADQGATPPARHPVVVVGAGPVGLALAIDLAQRGIAVVLLDSDRTLSNGSRAICFAKRTLEIFDQLGCGERMVAKGVSWNVGKVFFRDAQVYRFDLLPEPGHERPAFINLQQYYVEGFLVQRAAELPLIDLRWQHKVVGVERHADHALLTIETPDGAYRLRADHLVACDGSRSTVRELIGEHSQGRVFRDRFLIADVKIELDLPAERWFWFDPSFHPNRSVLLHRQPDNVWRIDFQLGWDADPEAEKKPENIIPRVRALLAHSTLKDVPFELEWASVYTFACTRMARFRHGRVIFAGDAAHGVSPFGARGANSGVQDAQNLAWKLAFVLRGQAPDALLDSYADEREAAADENIRHSTRATDFITPKSEISRMFRDAVLDLARHFAFARTLVNSGRLSVPATLDGSPLNTPDCAAFDLRMRPGAAAADAPVTLADGRDGWLLRQLGDGFTALVYDAGDIADAVAATLRSAAGNVPLRVLDVRACGATARADAPDRLIDRDGLIAERYDLLPGSTYLLRPDHHVCARWRQPSADALRSAIDRALALPQSPAVFPPDAACPDCPR